MFKYLDVNFIVIIINELKIASKDSDINDFFVIFLFFQFYGVVQDHPQENSAMFWLETI
jgi:hypothetical protein